MKKALLLLVMIFYLNIFSQSSNSFFKPFLKQNRTEGIGQKMATVVNLKDSSYYWNWNNLNNSWDFLSRTTFAYNSFYKENASVESSLNGAVWNEDYRNTNYIYDSNTNLLSQTSQFWSGAAWENISKTTNTYDASNNQLTALYQNWNPGTLMWENAYYMENTFDATNHQLSAISQNWNINTSSWDNSGKDTATYNASNEYTSYVSQTWNTVTSSWANLSKVINFVYLNGDMMSYEWPNWNNTTLAYEPASKDAYMYDSNHHMLNAVKQNWNISTSVWENSYTSDFTYDSNGNQITTINQTWNSSLNTWENSDRVYDYYTSFVGINELAGQKEAINIFPIPATSNITITCNNNQLFNEVSIFDVTGKVIVLNKLSETDSFQFNVSSLQSGVYFIQLNTETSSVYKKFIKD